MPSAGRTAVVAMVDLLNIGRCHRNWTSKIWARYHRLMAMTTVKIDPALRRGAALFHGLADRNRLAIVRQLAHGERRVVDLTGALGVAQGTVSGHLACLRDCGLVVGRPEGRQMFYSIAHPELLDVLGAAEELLALTGEAVEICPHYGPADTQTDAHTETTRTTTEDVAP